MSPTARSALGYLYGNCSGCHNAEGPLASPNLDFDQRLFEIGDARVRRTAVGVPSRFLLPGQSSSQRIAPGEPERSAVVYRSQMTDEDLKSVYWYLQSLPAIKNRVPRPRPPAAG